MKKVIITSIIVVMVLSLGVAFAGKGNNAPSGPHFNLNLIGIKAGHEKNMENCDSGHRIFVQLGEPKGKNPLPKTTDIKLVSCEKITGDPDCMEFGVLDCDGTDGEATFMLPNPDPSKERCTRYSVWIRPLGSPQGNPSFRMTTCATECFEWDGDVCVDKGDLVCSTEYVELTRSRGQMKFQDVSLELLTICVWVCVEWDTDPESPTYGDCLEWELQRRYLFDPMFVDYFWKLDNNGVKLVQLRFYLQESCYSEEDWTCKNPGNILPPE